MKKTIFFLIVFAVLFYSMPLREAYAACVSSSAIPSTASIQDSIAISFTLPATNTEVSYRLTIEDQNSITKATYTGKTDRHNAGGAVWQGTGQETVGPFSDGGNYKAKIYNTTTADTECFIPFSVIGAPTPTSNLPTPIPTDPAIVGTCKWLPGPPLEPESNCKSGFEPAIKAGSSAFAPECVCKPAGSSGTFPNAPTTIPTAPPPPVPCAKDQLINGKCNAVDTAIGNIATDPAKFIGRVFTLLLSMAGGLAVYLIIVSGYKLMFSSGEPEAVQGARETITSAIVGILFIILSIVLLQVIGADIFQIPGFGP